MMLNVEFHEIGFHLAWGPFDSSNVFLSGFISFIGKWERALLEDGWKFVKHLAMLSVWSTIHCRHNYRSGAWMSRALGGCLPEKNVWVNAG
jgi:hypothetical protein